MRTLLWGSVSVVAKGRKPQFSLEDLLKFLSDTRDLASDKPRLKTPIRKGTEQIIRQDVPLAVDFLSPLDTEEIGRLVTKGPDRGHAASLALYAALMRTNKIPDVIRGAVRGYRGTKEMLKEAPRGSRTQSRRTSGANMGGIINDPMAQYAAIIAATNRR